MLRVYGDVRSGNCYKVKLALHQLGKAYEWSDVDVVKGETRTPDFLALNPRGQIPLLITEDGTALPESNAILYYLCADSSLWPGDLMARTQVLRWMFFEQYTHEPAIAVARFIVAYLGRPAEREAALQQKIADGHKALALMETHLARHDFFAGAYSIADIALYAYTHVAEQGLVALETYPKVRAWLSRVAAQPGHVGMDG